MSRTTYSARITGPLHYTTSSGKQADVPLGPCLIEQVDGQGSTSSGGPSGEKSAELAFKELEAAEECGTSNGEHVVPAAHPCAVALLAPGERAVCA